MFLQSVLFYGSPITKVIILHEITFLSYNTLLSKTFISYGVK
jgi:hypothetical protein